MSGSTQFRIVSAARRGAREPERQRARETERQRRDREETEKRQGDRERERSARPIEHSGQIKNDLESIRTVVVARVEVSIDLVECLYRQHLAANEAEMSEEARADRETETETETKTGAETGTRAETGTQRQRHRDRDTETETETGAGTHLQLWHNVVLGAQIDHCLRVCDAADPTPLQCTHTHARTHTHTHTQRQRDHSPAAHLQCQALRTAHRPATHK
eukprot:COSAG03_NODE_7694_length_883_cov_1.394133_2_plen_218_part_01